MGEAVLFGIVEGIVCSTPVEVAAASFYRSPFRFVLTGNLVPKSIILWHATSGFHTSSGRNIAQELIRITRKGSRQRLGRSTDGYRAQ